MGTLHSQRPRVETLSSYHSEIRKALELMDVKGKPTAADWQAACDIVRTSLAIQSADNFDEQLSDAVRELAAALRTDHPLMGETFGSISTSIDRLADAVQGITQ